MKKFNNILSVGLAGFSLLGAVRFIDSTDFWIVNLLSHFPFQYALGSLLLLIIFLRRKMIAFSVLALLLFIFNISPVVDLEKSIHAAARAGTTFSVYSANIQKGNNDLSSLNSEIIKNDPDIVLLLEVSPLQIKQLRPIVMTYPFHADNISEGDRGLIFLTKFPVSDHHITRLSQFGNSLIEARLEINQKTIMFYGMHAQRPAFGNFSERKRQFFQPARQIREQSLPSIVAGDFNATPYSPVFRKFVSIAGLKDSREGFGWQPSWPTYFPPLWLPIDHILVSPDIHVHERTTGSYIGSDHYPVMAELSLDPQAGIR